MVIDKKDFESIRKRLSDEDAKREGLISESRVIVKLSKELIYGLHRNDNVDRIHDKINSALKAFDKKATPSMRSQGFYRVAVQEFVEAAAFYHYMKHGSIPSVKTLDIDDELYLLGLCDLPGELVRKAINSVINEDYKAAVKIKDAVSELYGQFMLMNLRNSELRKRFDGIKYDLKKLEELVLQLKLQNKI